MIKKNITITNPSGLNDDPALILSRHAREYQCMNDLCSLFDHGLEQEISS